LHRKHRDFDNGNYFTIMSMLLDAGVDPNRRGRWNYSCLHDIVFTGNCWGQILSTPEDRVRFGTILLDAGAKLNVRDDEILSTPLSWAARWNRIELVELYLNRGAKTQLPDDEPWATPLAWAQRYGHHEVADLLRR
jgi:ankyrin repeat protein